VAKKSVSYLQIAAGILSFWLLNPVVHIVTSGL
jgi:hypothetical protein